MEVPLPRASGTGLAGGPSVPPDLPGILAKGLVLFCAPSDFQTGTDIKELNNMLLNIGRKNLS